MSLVPSLHANQFRYTLSNFVHLVTHHDGRHLSSLRVERKWHVVLQQISRFLVIDGLPQWV